MKKTVRASLAFLLVFIIIFTTGVGAYAGPYTRIKGETSENGISAEEKIATTVHDAFREKDYVEVIIEMREQVDPERVAKQTLQAMDPDATPYNELMTRRYSVVESLKSTAERTQVQILELLEEKSVLGSVRSYQSFYIMNVIALEATKEAVREIAEYPEVKKITLDKVIEMEWPEASELIEPLSDNLEWNIDRVNAPKVWEEFGIDGTGVVVGMIDTGVHWEHESLKTRWRGYNHDNPDNPDPYGNWFDAVEGRHMPYDMASIPHGTHVMGTILGQTEENVIGVAPGATYIAARAFSDQGGQESWLLAAGEYMLAPEGDPNLAPDIVNNSWGGGSGIDEFYRPMVQAWEAAGIVPVFAAGNSYPETVSTPGNYPESYAVAATDINNQRGSFSSVGPGPYDDTVKPDISAPGVNVRSAVPGGYDSWNGTSMAAPHIAGVAALIRSVDASVTVDEIIDMINDTATPLSDSTYTGHPNNGYGWGLVDAYKAVEVIAMDSGTITGTVLKEGIDDTPPVIEHEEITFSYQNREIELWAEVSDDVSVVDVDLLILPEGEGEWQEYPMEQITGDFRSGEYRIKVPMEYVVEPGFSYQIRVSDFGGNEESTIETDVDVAFGIIPEEGLNTDFKSLPPGFLFGGDWQWGEPEVGPEPLLGEHLLATNLEGNYVNGGSSNLALPPLDLRNADEASLRLNHWYDIERMNDMATVAVTTDGGNSWETLKEFTGRERTWEPLYIDLADYVGHEEQIQIVFNLTSDEAVNYAGWYLDNLSVVGEDLTPPGAPENLQGYGDHRGVHMEWEAPVDPDVSEYRVYRDNGEGEQQIAAVEDLSYSDRDAEFGESYTYHVTAVDYAGNESAPSEVLSIDVPQLGIIYHSDFEEEDGGFSSSGDAVWEWGIPESGPNEAAVGDRLWGTKLSGSPEQGTSGVLISPEMTIDENYREAYISFAHWYDLDFQEDYGYVEITSDGGNTWETVETYTARFRRWFNETLEIHEYIGETIQLRFAVDVQGTRNAEGWYVDDLYIIGYEEEKEESPLTDEDNYEIEAVEDGEKRRAPTVNFLIPEGDSYEALEDKGAEGLPIDAVITVLETGRSVRSSLRDGSFRMVHPETPEGETYTLQVEAYGYDTLSEEFTLTGEEEVEMNFLLKETPRGTVELRIIDEETKEGIENVYVRIPEDHRIPDGFTDHEGRLVFEEILYGEYTIIATTEGYFGVELPVTLEEENLSVETELKPFPGRTETIQYEEGHYDDAIGMYAAGNGWGVRMSPEGLSQVTGAEVFIAEEGKPDPGSDEFGIAVYDLSGDQPQRVIGPFEVTGNRGEWNYVDLSRYGFITDEDFMVVMIHLEDNPYSPGIGSDKTSANKGHSYTYINRTFEKLDEEYGSIMIRSEVLRELDPPVILHPEDGTYTNNENIEISGEAAEGSEVTIYHNGDEITTLMAEDGTFRDDIALAEGENTFKAQAMLEGRDLGTTEEILVIRDTFAPELTLETPEDGEYVNTPEITVAGHAQDENLKEVRVNGEPVDYDEKGYFSETVDLVEGENEIHVIAEDLVENTIEKTLTVVLDTENPVISEVFPGGERYVIPGNEEIISFVSDSPEGAASFEVLAGDQRDTISMEEIEEGVYKGIWEVPDRSLEDVEIQIIHHDRAGNRTVRQVDANFRRVEQHVERLFGDNRFETALEVSRQGWDTAETVVLARSHEYADALAGVPLAYQMDAPILLTRPGSLHTSTGEEIERLGASKVIVLGGTAAIGNEVVEELEAMDITVERIAGENRYETAAKIAKIVAPDGVNQAVVVSGENYPDALSVAPFAANEGMPILLTREERIHDFTLEALEDLGVESTMVIGGPNAVNEDVMNQLPDPTRLMGENRYETNIRILEHFDYETNGYFAATGQDFADALTGAVLAAKHDTGIMLVHRVVPEGQKEFLVNRDAGYMAILGGETAISQEVGDAIYYLLTQ